jgi:hypothetical protein
VNEWINAKEQMPDKNGRYLVIEDHSYHWMGISTLRNGRFDMPILYWMDLPKKPEGLK